MTNGKQTMVESNLEIKKALLSMGLTSKEANVYLALLELGKGTVSQIARRANITRTYGYIILDALVNKGLANISGKEPKEEYVAASPNALRNLLAREIKNKQKSLAQVENIIPQLKSLYNIKGRPKVMFYEGLNGLKQVYEDTLTSHETIRAYAQVENCFKTLPDYFPRYYFRRAEKKIKIRAIFPDSSKARELKKMDKIQLRETALVPEKDFNFSPEINIYDNKIMIASWQERLGIIIESQEIAEAMKKAFELAWTEARRKDKQK